MNLPSPSNLPSACSVCGHSGDWLQGEPITVDLAAAWKLKPKEKVMFDLREGRLCPECKSSLRTQSLASMLLNHYGLTGTFDAFVAFATEHQLAILEINGFGSLTDKLSAIPGIIQSEYGATDKPAEDIQALSFNDGTFDLVLHSETLEHVPDPAKAMQECRRVMKPDGACLFSTPMVLSRKTVQCKQLAGSEATHLKPVSYHGYTREDYEVWWEFGGDILKTTGATVCFARPACLFYGLCILGPQHARTPKPLSIPLLKVTEHLARLKAPKKLSYNL